VWLCQQKLQLNLQELTGIMDLGNRISKLSFGSSNKGRDRVSSRQIIARQVGDRSISGTLTANWDDLMKSDSELLDKQTKF
jgi:hypothetical protein